MKVSTIMGDIIGRWDYERSLIKFVRDAIVIFAGNAALINQSADHTVFWQSLGVAGALALYRAGRDVLGFPADGTPVTPKPQ